MRLPNAREGKPCMSVPFEPPTSITIEPELSIPAPRQRAKSSLREYLEAFGLALLLALFIRSFIVQAFKIPSGSMLPTLEVGDHILVNKFTYGVRLPIVGKSLIPWGTRSEERRVGKACESGL